MEVETPFLVYYGETRAGMNASVRSHPNGSKEASAYLQFIAEYYDCLPEVGMLKSATLLGREIFFR